MTFVDTLEPSDGRGRTGWRVRSADAFLKSRGTYVVFRISRAASVHPLFEVAENEGRRDGRRDSDKAEITASPPPSFPFESECEEEGSEEQHSLTTCSSLLRHSIVVAMIHRIPHLL